MQALARGQIEGRENFLVSMHAGGGNPRRTLKGATTGATRSRPPKGATRSRVPQVPSRYDDSDKSQREHAMWRHIEPTVERTANRA